MNYIHISPKIKVNRSKLHSVNSILLSEAVFLCGKEESMAWVNLKTGFKSDQNCEKLIL